MRVEQGKSGEAVTLGEKAVELDPGNDDLAIAYARLLEQDGQYENALEVLRPMLEREPPIFDAVLTFGQFAPLIGMKDRAITLIEQLQKLDGLTDQQETTFGEALDWLHDQT